MKEAPDRRVNRAILFAAITIFLAGLALLLKSVLPRGISEARQLFSVLVASYLSVWGGIALLSRTSRDEIRTGFVLISLSLATALMLAEATAGLGLVDYRQVFAIRSGLPWEEPRFVPDRELVALPRPNSSEMVVFSRGNIGEGICLPARPVEPFKVKYDKNGFRNDDDFMQADIAVIGDSYVESPMIPGGLLATTRLSDMQGKSVVNLGQSGYGPQQELVVLRRYALPLSPEWIVWVFYEGNDLADASAYAQKVALINESWDSLNTYWDRSFIRNSLNAGVRWLQGCSPLERVAANYSVVTLADGHQERMYFVDHSTTLVPTGQELEALQETAENLREAFELAQEAGARFMVVHAPTKFRVYHDIGRFNLTPPGDIRSWVLNDLPERLRQIVAEISPEILYLDLTLALSTAAKTGNLMFIPDDTHWTSDGHRVVAETIDQALRSADRAHGAGREFPEPAMGRMLADLARDAVIVRNSDGTIRYWSEGAHRVYGWDAHEALGEISHQLLKTVFPEPLATIEAELRAGGSWHGNLIQERHDGTRLTVSSRWELQQNVWARDQSVTIVEISKVLTP